MRCRLLGAPLAGGERVGEGAPNSIWSPPVLARRAEAAGVAAFKPRRAYLVGPALAAKRLDLLACTTTPRMEQGSCWRTSDPGGASIIHDLHSSAVRLKSQIANVASIFRVITSNVASRLRVILKYQQASSLLLPCCDHVAVATLLRSVLRATSNIMSLTPRHNTNIICPQHRNSTSVILKFNVYNTQHQRPSSLPPRRNTQHHMFATSKLDIRNI
jgi:hypothetical protein